MGENPTNLEFTSGQEGSPPAKLEAQAVDVKKSPIAEEDLPASAKPLEDDRSPKIEFQCSTCKMRVMVHYHGQTPPFMSGLSFLEDTYVLQDPSKPPPPRWKPKPECFVAIGADCVGCKRTVCKDTECSFFYTRTYCLPCAEKESGKFPVEARAKLRKLMKRD